MPLQYGNAIGDLKAERMGEIVHNKHVLQLSVLENTQIFDEKPVFSLHTVFAGQNFNDNFTLGVQEVDNCVGVSARGGCKQHYFVVLTHDFQEFQTERPNVQAQFHTVPVVAVDGQHVFGVFLQ